MRKGIGGQEDTVRVRDVLVLLLAYAGILVSTWVYVLMTLLRGGIVG